MHLNIQALRFFSALAVLLFHASQFYRHYKGELANHFTPILVHGDVGVHVFFVISGFVIWTSTEGRHGPSHVRTFIWRRLGRIFLGYWPWLAFAAVLRVFVMHSDLSEFSVIKSVTLLPKELVPAGKLYLPVSWSLTFELMFYVMFAVLMFLPRRVALWMLVMWGAAALWTKADPTWLSPFVAEFAAGCVLASVVSRVDLAKISVLGVLALAAFCLINGLAYKGADPMRIVWLCGFSLALILACLWFEAKNLIAPKWMVEMGGASYALYLCHFPILQGFGSYWGAMKAYPDAMIGTVIVLSLTASWLWWVYFERPAVKRMNAMIAQRDRVFAA